MQTLQNYTLSWVKRSSRLKWAHNENMESNFKHACGLAIELVSETITSLKREKNRYDFDTEVCGDDVVFGTFDVTVKS